jgi:hypothetical protein
LTAQVQNFTTGTSGTDFGISSTGSTHTFNLPSASATNRGLLSSADWTTFNNKQPAGSYVTLNTAQTITAQKTFTTSGGTDSVIISTTGAGFALDAIKAGDGEVIRVNKTSGLGNAMSITGGVLTTQGITTTAPSNGIGILVNGRSSDNVSLITFGANTGGGQYNFIQASPTSLIVGSRGNTPIEFHTNVNGGGGPRLTIGGSGAVTLTGALNGTSASFSSGNLNTILVSNPNTTGATTGSGIGFSAFNGTSVTQSAGIILTSNAWSFGTYLANELSIGSDGSGGLALRSANSAPIRFYTGGTTAGLSTQRLEIASTGAATFSSSVTAASLNVRGSSPQVQIGISGGNYIELTDNQLSAKTSAGAASNLFLNVSGANTILNRDSGNVGIGTSSPSERLEILGPDGSGAAVRWRMAGGRKSGYLYSDSAGVAIYDTNLNDAGIYLAQNSQIDFRVSGSQRMIITSGGNVGIGTISPATTLEVLGANVSEYLRVGGGTITGRSLTFSSFDSSGLSGVSHRMNVPNTNGQLSFAVGGVDKVNVTNNGLTFNGDTAAANALDDYEEGTWTPSFTLDGGSVSGVTSGGTYIKIGRQVTITFVITFPTTSSALINNITNFPFTSENTTRQAIGSVRESANTGNQWHIRINANNTEGLLRRYDNNQNLSNGFSFTGTLTYFTA